MIVDVWMQHPSARHLAHEMFDSLRRWTRNQDRVSVITPEMTIGAMDQGGNRYRSGLCMEQPERMVDRS